VFGCSTFRFILMLVGAGYLEFAFVVLVDSHLSLEVSLLLLGSFQLLLEVLTYVAFPSLRENSLAKVLDVPLPVVV
jgi:hypothetical protein